MTLILTRGDVERALDPDQLLEVLADGFRAISTGNVSAPPRGELLVGGGGRLLLMPAAVPGQPFGTKLVSLFAGNAKRAKPTHLGLIVLMDQDTGEPLAVMDAEHVTALRTAGAAALAAQLLAQPDARVITVIGAGVQAEAHLRSVPPLFQGAAIHVAARRPEAAEALASLHPRAIATNDIEEAVRASDIVLLCSASDCPLISDAWIRPGQHISSVGYAPPGGELDPAIAQRHRLFVETRLAFAPPPVGCAELAGIDPDRGTELGEILLGRRMGRENASDVTVYKAMGHAVEDVAAANLALRTAKALGLGTNIALWE